MTTERMTDEVLCVVEMQVPRLLLELHRARRAEQEQAEKIRALDVMLALVMGERDAAETKAAHLEARLKVAHETIATTNDNMAEQVRQARWEVATEALEASTQTMYAYLRAVRDVNAPKD